ncbi:MAG: META domain-containing protein [Saprospiraceae bacterium]|nr:META domain-containing protein [Saprospiraceae bacterium]
MKNLAFLGALLFLMSCNTGKKAQDKNQLFLTGTKWTILKVRESMVTNSISSRTIELSLPNRKGEGTFTGNTGCNTINGKYKSEKGSSIIHFSDIASTKMACPNDNQENIIIGALEKINSYEVSGKILKLYAGGELLLTLEGVNVTQ